MLNFNQVDRLDIVVSEVNLAEILGRTQGADPEGLFGEGWRVGTRGGVRTSPPPEEGPENVFCFT